LEGCRPLGLPERYVFRLACIRAKPLSPRGCGFRAVMLAGLTAETTVESFDESLPSAVEMSPRSNSQVPAMFFFSRRWCLRRIAAISESVRRSANSSVAFWFIAHRPSAAEHTTRSPLDGQGSLSVSESINSCRGAGSAIDAAIEC